MVYDDSKEETMEKTRVSYRLTHEASQLLAALARKRGINRTSMLEILIRDAATREGLRPPHPSPPKEV